MDSTNAAYGATSSYHGTPVRIWVGQGRGGEGGRTAVVTAGLDTGPEEDGFMVFRTRK